MERLAAEEAAEGAAGATVPAPRSAADDGVQDTTPGGVGLRKD